MVESRMIRGRKTLSLQEDVKIHMFYEKMNRADDVACPNVKGVKTWNTKYILRDKKRIVMFLGVMFYRFA